MSINPRKEKLLLMTNFPSKGIISIDISIITRNYMTEHLYCYWKVKLIFLGVLGVATMWEAVFGDMGVAIIAILNAMRVMK